MWKNAWHLASMVWLLALVPGCGGTHAEDASASAKANASSENGVSQASKTDRVLNAPSDPAAEWSNWRGPGSRAIVDTAQLPDPWPAGLLGPVWNYPLGTGWSSPVVSEGRLFITDRTQDRERLVALDAASGELLWESVHAVDFDPHAVGRRHGNGPKSTPVVDRGRVYSLGIAGHLECTDAATGAIRWQFSLPQRFGRHEPLPGGRGLVNGTENVIVPIGQGRGAPVPLFGYTGSPVIGDGKLILEVGGQRGGTVMAFDCDSGEVVWQALDENVSYSSPVIAELAGRKQVVAMTGPRVVGLDLADGRLLWSHPFQIQYDESISTPVVAGNLVLVTGDSRPLTALEVARQGDGIQCRVAWRNDDLSSYLSSPLAFGGHVYGMNDDGEFVCVRLSDGKTIWRGGNHGFYSSPVLAGDRLLALNEDGELAILAAMPQQYRLLAVSTLADSATWTMPAVVGRKIFVRTEADVRGFEPGAAKP